MRTNLKIYRIKQHLSQSEMAEKIGCNRATYAAIESGARNGKQSVWIAFQKAFNLPDTEMWMLMRNDK